MNDPNKKPWVPDDIAEEISEELIEAEKQDSPDPDTKPISPEEKPKQEKQAEETVFFFEDSSTATQEPPLVLPLVPPVPPTEKKGRFAWFKNLFKRQESDEPQPNFRLMRRIFFGFIGVVFLVFVGLFIYVTTDLPPMTLIENPNSDLSTQLISADGVVLHKYYANENRVNLRLNEISPHVVNALIATEDVRFYTHSGVDPQSFFTIIKEGLLGGGIRGGSTITMQLVRNLYDQVGDDPLLIRKLKEYIVAAYIERRFTKQEVMEAYLNTVNIYGNSYGIETASNRLFDKSAKDLTLEEAALIVGMLKGQGVYNPFRHPERVKTRRNTVINLMASNGLIPNGVKLDSLKELPIKLTSQELSHVKGLAPYFREMVRQELQTWCEENGYNLYTDGLRVYTTIDSRMQSHAEEAVRAHMRQLQQDFDKVENKGKRILDKDPAILLDLKRKSQRYLNAQKAGKSESEIDKEFRTKVKMTLFAWEGPQEVEMTPLDSLRYYARFLETGLVSIDPTNGHIKAWVGGNDFRFFKYDHVAKGKRQVGSTFKPFVYGAAVEANKEPCEKFLNQPVVFENPGGGRWVPKNSDGSFGGKLTMRDALAKSVNLVTARLMKEIGPHAVADFAYRMGIESKLDEVPSLCLGTTDLSVIELTSAYSTFANYGNRNEPIKIIRIEDRSGKVLADFSPKSKTVLNPEKAYLMVELLKGVVDFGTAHRLRYRYKFTNQIGGKTGTTQNQSDGWFMGITPNLVTGVWVGHQDRRMHFRSIRYGQGANMALPIWAIYMKQVYGDARIGLPEASFDRPPEVAEINLNCRSEYEDSGEGKGGKTPDVDDLDDSAFE